MKKKLLSALLCAAMTVLMTACGLSAPEEPASDAKTDTKTDAPADEKTDDATEDKADDAATAPAGEAEVVLTFAEVNPLDTIVGQMDTAFKDKVAELLGGTRIDEGLVATEITIFADKVCVDEETVRLRSHIANMEDTLSKDEPVGRKLDFIAQEMNREANTILSKANDAELSSLAIDLKTGIEKIREQIQNIE